MTLPFSHDAFLDVFAAYNGMAWPAVIVLWVVTAWLFARASTRRITQRPLLALMALHWAWSGIAYHWGFFQRINPAAWLFGALFVVQAVVFLWLATRPAASAPPATATGRRLLGSGLVIYGLAYPAIGLAFGLDYPRMPVFAVPCPTTLVTAGLLILSSDLPRFVNVIPALWAVVGSSAAFALGIRADLALVVAAIALIVDVIAPSLLGPRAGSVST